MKMPVFSMPLTDAERLALDRIRAARGLKSAADAIRKLIEENDPENRRPVLKALTREEFEAIPPTTYVPTAAKPLSSMSGKPSPKGGKGK